MANVYARVTYRLQDLSGLVKSLATYWASPDGNLATIQAAAGFYATGLDYVSGAQILGIFAPNPLPLPSGLKSVAVPGLMEVGALLKYKVAVGSVSEYGLFIPAWKPSLFNGTHVLYDDTVVEHFIIDNTQVEHSNTAYMTDAHASPLVSQLSSEAHRTAIRKDRRARARLG